MSQATHFQFVEHMAASHQPAHMACARSGEDSSMPTLSSSIFLHKLCAKVLYASALPSQQISRELGIKLELPWVAGKERQGRKLLWLGSAIFDPESPWSSLDHLRWPPVVAARRTRQARRLCFENKICCSSTFSRSPRSRALRSIVRCQPIARRRHPSLPSAKVAWGKRA